MAENLVIVESPAKAKTIEKYLGKDYVVKSSFGHIRDLSKKNYGIDIKNNFAPKYIIDAGKKKLVAELKKEVEKAKMVWLASDEDREGEAIAWHLAEVLNLKKSNSKRIVFNEITKSAIIKAIENPRDIDENLVNAQQARRILDRLVGFELSEVLWKKVKSQLSAGRVQSVAVRLLVEREREIFSFNSVSSYKVIAIFIVKDKKGKQVELKAELNHKFKNKEDALQFIEKCKISEFSVGSIETKPTKKTPSAPFTTSTLQQEASRKLGYSVAQTMTIAQKLYEEGKITYMRTDSVNLSDEALENTKKYILQNYGEKFLKPRKFQTKTKGAQEAHEAIRPTAMIENVSSDRREQKLYELIFNRTLACQMSDAILEKTTISVNISKTEDIFIAIGEILKFEGFLKAYGYANEDEEEEESVLLPEVLVNQKLNYKTITATEKFSSPSPRYTEASLVRKLEELGIGRPSTYAPIISTIQKRGYVVKEDKEGLNRDFFEISLQNNKIESKKKTEIAFAEKKKLFPTDIAMVVNDFLVENFNNVLDYNFTANVEKEFDEIAEGKVVWNKMISDFYTGFHKLVENTVEKADRKTGERELGLDPKSGKKVITRIGRFGPIVQLGEGTENEKPQYASLRKDQHIETLTLEQAIELLYGDNNGKYLGDDPQTGKRIYARLGKFGAMVQRGSLDDKEKPEYASLLKGLALDKITFDEALALFRFPRELGEFENKKITVGVGKFGPFVKHDSKFTSLKKTDNPLSITTERAIELIIEKRDADEKRLIKEFDEDANLKIIKDRWGKPCIFFKKKYTRIPKEMVPEKLTYNQCLEIVKD